MIEYKTFFSKKITKIKFNFFKEIGAHFAYYWKMFNEQVN